MLLKLTTYIPAWKYTECDINLLWFSICKAMTTNNPAASVTTEECTVLLTQCWHQTCMFLHNLSSSMLIEHKLGPTNLLEMLPSLGYLFFCISSASPSYWWLPGFSEHGFSERGMRCLYTLAPGLRLLSPGTLSYPKQTPTQLCGIFSGYPLQIHLPPFSSQLCAQKGWHI